MWHSLSVSTHLNRRWLKSILFMIFSVMSNIQFRSLEASQCLTCWTFRVYVCNLTMLVIGYIDHAKERHSHIKFKSSKVKSYLEYCIQLLDLYFEEDIDKIGQWPGWLNKIIGRMFRVTEMFKYKKRIFA